MGKSWTENEHIADVGKLIPVHSSAVIASSGVESDTRSGPE